MGEKINDVYRSSRLPKKVFDETTITAGLRWQLEEIQKIDFKNQKQNIVIVGDVATGKTSLATKIAKEAIEIKAVAVYTTEEDLLIAVRQQKSHWNKIMHSDLIVRLWNKSDEDTTADIKISLPITKAELVKMNEEKISDIQLTNGKMSVKITRHKIVTVKIK